MATVIDASYLSSTPTAPFVAPGGGNKAAYFDRSDDYKGWERISSQLDEWLKLPEHEDEDGYVSPSTAAINVATEILNAMRMESFSAPTWVVMTGDGGISIELENGPQKVELEIDECGEQEARFYSYGRLVAHGKLTLVDVS